MANNNSSSGSPPISTLAELNPGEQGTIDRIEADASLKRRLSALGIVKGTKIYLDFTAPMGDPRAYSLLGYQLSLRNEDARRIILRAGN